MKNTGLTAIAVTLVLALGSLPMTAQNAVRNAGDGYLKDYRKASALYEKGMFSEASSIYDNISELTNDPQAEGMSVLCAVRSKAYDYQEKVEEYAKKCPYSGLVPEIRYRYGLNLFDEGLYQDAYQQFCSFPEEKIAKEDKAEFLFKKAYCCFEAPDYDHALSGFAKVDALAANDYTAPSRYLSGYIDYERREFNDALGWFNQSVKDPRFEDMSSYYIMECHFMLKDYDYVTSNAKAVYDKVPEERRPHLARLISESYLVKGDAGSAAQYYEDIRNVPDKSREDYFYAGSLLYALEDWQGAIDNYSKMTDRTDSLGQIANYQMAFSDIQTKNKVAAMTAFKDAAAVSVDKDIQEDAFYNYAKLSFDLNHDGSVFKDYMSKYPDRAKNDQIYSYIALACLYSHDYEGAVEAYDNIDDLDPDMRNNYMKANYLRANQLINSGSYRSAEPCLKSATYYSDKRSQFNQLAKYWLAESYYRDDQYSTARTSFTDLYNISALDGKEEGKLIPYDIAYCYFKEGDYPSAVKWFDNYISQGNVSQKRDALIRKADCSFINKDYKAAGAAYETVASSYPDKEDVYANYQAGVSYGLAENVKKKIDALAPVKNADPSAYFYPDAMYELARAYVADSQDDNAISCYNVLIRNTKDSSFVAKSLLDLGLLERNRNENYQALSYYKQVVEEMPSSEYAKDALNAIEAIYQTTQEPEKYVSYVESLGSSPVTADTDMEDMLFNAAEQIYLAENWQKALLSLQSYNEKYPDGKHVGESDFYMADCYKNLGKKEQACDWYRKVIDRGTGNYVEISVLNLANISYEMERWEDAYNAYSQLADVAKIETNKYNAAVGMMRSALRGKDYANAIANADKVENDKHSTSDEKREAQFVKAKSLMATSQRDEALTMMKNLSKQSKTAEGAESAYLVIQDSYDQGKFDDVEALVYKFADSGTDQTYWLAKSFITLGDSFVEKGDYKQAKATFESVKEGYKGDDDVLDNIEIRLKKLAELSK